jgi:SAM-dependent methyltransferase
MGKIKHALAGTANSLLRPLGAKLVVPVEVGEKPWDRYFKLMIDRAEATGEDPNDFVDEDWGAEMFRHTFESHYSPHLSPDTVVLELGPGLGRLTRLVLPKVKKMVLVDYSQFACDWLEKYCGGRGEVRIVKIERPSLGFVPGNSIDLVLSQGVFDHLDVDIVYCFLDEFYRVLKPGGAASFNFFHMSNDSGTEFFLKTRNKLGDGPSIFRFFHPDTMTRLVKSAGFDVLQLETFPNNHGAVIQIQKPMRHS